MSEPAGSTRGGSARTAQPALAAAFASEVGERLPRLVAAAAALRAGHPADSLGDSPLRDAHTLASSAAVVGLPQAAQAARRLELLLRAHPAGNAEPGFPAAVAAGVDELRTALAGVLHDQ